MSGLPQRLCLPWGYVVISIIDDDKVVREAVGTLVESLGYATATFASANEYLGSDILQDTKCLITDLNMPGMSGIDLQGRLARDGHHTPIIFMTAYFDEKVRAQALNAGALGFLRKPFASQALIECLETALQHRADGR
jgi:FixJ family two-component response regulator